MSRRLLPLAALVIALAAGCGGGSSSGGSGSGGTKSSHLVTDVSDATAKVTGKEVVATVKVKEGGKPGEHLTLSWGLIDAVSGVRASQGERIIARLTTTPAVVSHTYTVRFRPTVPTQYLIHFALYAPGGEFLASKDTDEFSIG